MASSIVMAAATAPAHTVLLLFTTAITISTSVEAAENPAVHFQRNDEELTDLVNHLDQDDNQQHVLLKRELREAEYEGHRNKKRKNGKPEQDENDSVVKQNQELSKKGSYKKKITKEINADKPNEERKGINKSKKKTKLMKQRKGKENMKKIKKTMKDKKSDKDKIKVGKKGKNKERGHKKIIKPKTKNNNKTKNRVISKVKNEKKKNQKIGNVKNRKIKGKNHNNDNKKSSENKKIKGKGKKPKNKSKEGKSRKSKNRNLNKVKGKNDKGKNKKENRNGVLEEKKSRKKNTDVKKNKPKRDGCGMPKARCKTIKGKCGKSCKFDEGERGVKGCKMDKGCKCCVKKNCYPGKQCRKLGGLCKKKCNDNQELIKKGCKGKNCKLECCVRKCIPKPRCKDAGGSCIGKKKDCTGDILKNQCKRFGAPDQKQNRCHCCVPKLPLPTTPGSGINKPSTNPNGSPPTNPNGSPPTTNPDGSPPTSNPNGSPPTNPNGSPPTNPNGSPTTNPDGSPPITNPNGPSPTTKPDDSSFTTNSNGITQTTNLNGSPPTSNPNSSPPTSDPNGSTNDADPSSSTPKVTTDSSLLKSSSTPSAAETTTPTAAVTSTTAAAVTSTTTADVTSTTTAAVTSSTTELSLRQVLLKLQEALTAMIAALNSQQRRSAVIYNTQYAKDTLNNLQSIMSNGSSSDLLSYYSILTTITSKIKDGTITVTDELKTLAQSTLTKVGNEIDTTSSSTSSTSAAMPSSAESPTSSPAESLPASSTKSASLSPSAVTPIPSTTVAILTKAKALDGVNTALDKLNDAIGTSRRKREVKRATQSPTEVLNKVKAAIASGTATPSELEALIAEIDEITAGVEDGSIVVSDELKALAKETKASAATALVAAIEEEKVAAEAAQKPTKPKKDPVYTADIIFEVQRKGTDKPDANICLFVNFTQIYNASIDKPNVDGYICINSSITMESTCKDFTLKIDGSNTDTILQSENKNLNFTLKSFTKSDDIRNATFVFNIKGRVPEEDFDFDGDMEINIDTSEDDSAETDGAAQKRYRREAEVGHADEGRLQVKVYGDDHKYTTVPTVVV